MLATIIKISQLLNKAKFIILACVFSVVVGSAITYYVSFYLPNKGKTTQQTQTKAEENSPNSGVARETTQSSTTENQLKTTDLPKATTVVVTQKPDYSEIIATVDKLKDCWKKCETIEKVVKEDGKVELKKVDCKKDRDSALKQLDTAKQKLLAGTFIDIYSLPWCQGMPRPLLPSTK
jgi:hypothetical protein